MADEEGADGYVISKAQYVGRMREFTATYLSMVSSFLPPPSSNDTIWNSEQFCSVVKLNAVVSRLRAMNWKLIRGSEF